MEVFPGSSIFCFTWKLSIKLSSLIPWWLGENSVRGFFDTKPSIFVVVVDKVSVLLFKAKMVSPSESPWLPSFMTLLLQPSASDS